MLSRLMTVIGALLLATVSLAAHAETLRIENPYFYPPIGSGKIGVGFMVIHNEGDTDRALLHAESDAIDEIELHDHINEDGILRMRKVPQIPVEAGGSVTLKPGGLHVMLMGVNEEVAPGDQLEVTFTFDQDERQTISVPVLKRGTRLDRD